MRTRPALVVSTAPLGPDGSLLWALMITSIKGRQLWPEDVPIGPNHASFGLPVPCVVRTAKLSTLSIAQIENKIGRLPDDVMIVVRRELARHLPA